MDNKMHVNNSAWRLFDELHVGNCSKVQYNTINDVVVLKAESQEYPYTRAIQGKWLVDNVKLSIIIIIIMIIEIVNKTGSLFRGLG